MKTLLMVLVTVYILLFSVMAQAANLTGTVTATIVPPTTNTDGTPIAAGEIAKYNVYCGSAAGAEVLTATCWTGNATAVSISGIASGTDVYMKATAVTTAGMESALSNEVKKNYTYVAPIVTPNAPTIK